MQSIFISRKRTDKLYIDMNFLFFVQRKSSFVQFHLVEMTVFALVVYCEELLPRKATLETMK